MGVDDDGQVKFKRTRATSSFKSPWLQQFVMNPPPWAFRLITISKPRMLKRLKGVRKRIKTWNSSDAKPRQVLTDAMRARLREYFAEDVEKLFRPVVTRPGPLEITMALLPLQATLFCLPVTTTPETR